MKLHIEETYWIDWEWLWKGIYDTLYIELVQPVICEARILEISNRIVMEHNDMLFRIRAS